MKIEPVNLLTEAETQRAGRYLALMKARRYLRWARRTETALSAYQRTERAAWDALARVNVREGSLPEAVGRVVDSLISSGIAVDLAAKQLAEAHREIARLERELAQAQKREDVAIRLAFTPPWEQL